MADESQNGYAARNTCADPGIDYITDAPGRARDESAAKHI